MGKILFYLILFMPGLAFAQNSNWNIQYSPSVNLYDVESGDKRRARMNFQREQVTGGIEQFSLKEEMKGSNLNMDGRLLSERDFGLNLNLWGVKDAYLNVKADTFRYYFDNSNLYYAKIPGGSRLNTYEVDDKLYTDRGVYGFEGGLTLLEKHKVLLGYEHKERKGKEDLYTGGWIREFPGNNWIVWEYPLSEKVNYDSDKVYSGITTKLLGYNWSTKVEWEKFSGKREHMEPGYWQSYPTNSLAFRRFYETKPDYISWNFDTKADRYFLNDKLLFNLGYRYQKVETTSGFDVDSFQPNGTRHYGEHSLNFLESTHNGRNDTHIVNLILSAFPAKYFKPWASLTLRKGRSNSDSVRGEEGAEGAAADGNTNTVDERWIFESLNDERSVAESVGFEITGIPKTSLNLTADFEQKKTNYDWSGDINEIWAGTDDGDWRWKAGVKDFRQAYKVSSRTRPVDWLTVSSKYRYRLNDSKVNNLIRSFEYKPGDPEYESGIPTSYYYPGRIGNSKKPSHKFDLSFDTKVNERMHLRPYYGFFLERNNISGEPEEGISEYESNTFGLGLNLQPKDNLTLFFDVSDRIANSHSRSADYTRAVNSTYFGGITEDFNNSAFTTSGGISCQLSKYTFNLNSGFVKGRGIFDTELLNTGFGMDYSLGKDATLKSAYSFYKYGEEDNGGINDYKAHAIYLSLNKKF